MAADNSQIKIRLEDGKWVDARDYQKEAYKDFIKEETDIHGRELKYDKNGFKFKIIRLLSDDSKQNDHGGTYLIRENGIKSPIADWNNVKVFLTIGGNIDWYQSRPYQTWSYMHYVYSNANKIGYYSKGSLNPPQGYIEIPIDNISPNIIFTISRNDNGTIFYETNNVPPIRNRISDNENYRRGYRSFINRIIDDGSEFKSAPSNISQKIPRPAGVLDIVTVDENKMCQICNNFEKNIKFIPCNHEHTCYSCYELSYPSLKNKCPFCKQEIKEIKKIDDKKDGKYKYLKYKQKYLKLKYELLNKNN